MIVLTVASPKGGVGKTSVTANLAAALAARGRRVVAVDLDPQNALRLHMGVPPTEISGTSRSTLAGEPWGRLMFQAPHGVRLLPFGELNDQDMQRFEVYLEEHPEWLAEHLRTLGLAADDIVLIDTPPGHSPYLRQALAVAHRVLIVLLADAASYATIPQISRLVDTHCAQRREFQGSHLLVNQVDTARHLARDVLNAMRAAYGPRILGTIHSDQAVSEALAYDQTVFDYAPHSVAALDFNHCADKLLNLLAPPSLLRSFLGQTSGA
ncbi:cellulose biosynthesis protein BcsQ [Ideonella sp.]|uniref:cellulose biosynthesis protein BcsQ n=1 Tax=Ideonella sp. TaxID=1929293 RepID=UPI003BB6EB83